jgi:hypothetical protein
MEIGRKEGLEEGMKRCEENRQMKEKDEGNWKHGYGHCVLVEEGSLMLVVEVAKAIASKEAKPTTQSNTSTQVSPTTIETATQTENDPTTLLTTPPITVDATAALLMMPAQPPSAMSTLPSTMPTFLTTSL